MQLTSKSEFVLHHRLREPKIRSLIIIITDKKDKRYEGFIFAIYRIVIHYLYYYRIHCHLSSIRFNFKSQPAFPLKFLMLIELIPLPKSLF